MGKVLVAGMGNMLRGDDGFGVEVVRRLQGQDVPAGVEVVEAGSAGIGLVQKLMDGYDFLIVVDAATRGKAPGTLYTLKPMVEELAGLEWDQLSSVLGDLHDTDPTRVLLIAKALGILPKKVLIVACEPTSCEELETTLSGPVAKAVDAAVDRALELARGWLDREGESVMTW